MIYFIYHVYILYIYIHTNEISLKNINVYHQSTQWQPSPFLVDLFRCIRCLYTYGLEKSCIVGIRWQLWGWRRETVCLKKTSDGTILRIFQHTPGTYPRPPTNSLWRSSFHLGLRGCLGYAPRVCWGSLRTMVSWKRWFHFCNGVYHKRWYHLSWRKNHEISWKRWWYSWWFKLIDVMIDCNMSLPETSSSPMKTDGWKTRLSFGARPILRGYVSFREGSRLDFLFSFEKWEMDSYI